MTITPTEEQLHAIQAFNTGENLVITAVAGSGKTTTITQMANQSTARGLYAAFNKVTAEEAGAKLPRNVQARTTHSLAYGAIVKWGSHQQKRLNGRRQTGRDVAKILGIEDHFDIGDRSVKPDRVAAIAKDTVKHYCNSDADEIQPWHVPRQDWAADDHSHKALQQLILPFARKAWRDVQSGRGRLTWDHSYYRKMWALTHPVLNYDFILLDEAQDTSQVVVGVLREQQCQVVTVGDENQALYGWNGAVDAMHAFDAEFHLTLSQSFRFGPVIAEHANLWLDLLSSPVRVIGSDWIPSTISDDEAPNTVLCRTNAGCMEQVMASLRMGNKPSLVGGADDVRKFAEAAKGLLAGKKVNHPDLGVFGNWESVKAYVMTEEAGKELSANVKLVDTYGPDAIIEAALSTVLPADADLIVSTAHKCVRPETLVETPAGLMRMADIPESGVIGTPTGARAYMGKFTKAEGRILDLRTRHGYELGVTPEHGMTVWRPGLGLHTRVEAKDLVLGDWLRLRLGAEVDAIAPALLPEPAEADARASQWTTPSVMTDELAELLGLLVADGTIFAGGKGFRVVKRHADVIDRMDLLVKEVFGYSVTRRIHSGTPCGEVHSTLIGRWLLSLGGLAPNAKGVPSSVLRSPLSMQAAFLRGLFEDGTVNVKNGKADHIHWDNYDHAVARDVQVMLLRLGVTSTLKRRHGISTLYLYGGAAELFASSIGFIAAEKNERAALGFGAGRKDLIPMTRAELAPLEGLMSVTDKQNARARGYMSRAKALHLLERAGEKDGAVLVERLRWLYSPLVAFEDRTGETMCVTVPEGSRFLQNGFDGWNSKGLEWPRVRIHDDFPEPSEKKPLTRPDAMLCYVATTRAQQNLDPFGVEWVYNQQGRAAA